MTNDTVVVKPHKRSHAIRENDCSSSQSWNEPTTVPSNPRGTSKKKKEKKEKKISLTRVDQSRSKLRVSIDRGFFPTCSFVHGDVRNYTNIKVTCLQRFCPCYSCRVGFLYDGREKVRMCPVRTSAGYEFWETRCLWLCFIVVFLYSYVQPFATRNRQEAPRGTGYGLSRADTREGTKRTRESLFLFFLRDRKMPRA